MITSFKLFFESLYEAKTYKQYKKVFGGYTSLDGVPMNDDLGNAIIEADPTEVKEYRNFLFKLFKNSNYEDFISKLEQLTEFLKIYNIGKLRMPENNEKKDINKISDFEDLENVVKYILDNNLHMSEKKRLATKTDERYELYMGEEWSLIIPLTYEQSKFWAKGADWCTARANDSSFFRTYTALSPIYIFYCKNDVRRSHQLFLWNSEDSNHPLQFKNYGNNEVPIDAFLKEHPEFISPLIDFWKSGDEVLKNSLVEFFKTMKKDKNVGNRKSWTFLLDILIDSDALVDSLSDENLESFIEDALNSSSLGIIKKYFQKKPESVISKFSDGKTPILTVMGSKASNPIVDDPKTKEICEYLVSVADEIGVPIMTEDEYADAISNSLSEKKYKTCLYLSSLPGYDLTKYYGYELRGENRNLSQVNLFLCALGSNISPDGSSGFSYEEAEMLISNLVNKGVNLDFIVDANTNKSAFTMFLKRLDNPNAIKHFDILLSNAKDICGSLQRIYGSGVNLSPEVSALLDKHKKNANC